MSWLQGMTPRHIQKLIPYASARRENSTGEVWLNANENPYECTVPEGLSKINRYPDFQPKPLMKAYSRYAGVGPEQLLVTRGIDEGIDLLIRAFCQMGEDSIMYLPPTYGMYKISAETHGVTALPVPLLATWEIDLDALAKPGAQSKLIFLCSPNNPTGNILDPGDVETVLRASQGQSLVILDEAYIEFKPQSSLLRLLSQYSNLVILRTLSKGFGLAGLRCGFVMASPEIIDVLAKVAAPYPIPVPVVDLASQALSEEGVQCMLRNVEVLRKDGEKLRDLLSTLSFVAKVYDTAANFILFQVNDAPGIMKFLLGSGVVIRDQSRQVGLENTLRVTVGTEAENQIFYECMQAYEAQL